VSEPLESAEERLLQALAGSARGPKRNGVFALWMFLRACEGVLPPDPLSPRAHRRRLEGLERRLTSLSLPAPLKRALASGLRELADGNGLAAGMALQRLVAPARETLGSEVADLIGSAARTTKELGLEHAPTTR
jgi:hypothetical protein